MKQIFKILFFTTLFVSGVGISKQAEAQQVNVSLSVFQNSLSPYGRWVNHGTYGQVWIANTAGFVPYQTGGHWAYTDYGWTWVSDYDWGWAPFHYGRWAYEPGFGWYWVPGYDWAPAWVAWRNNNDYYGWAPLSPGMNISIGVSFGNEIPYDRWVFAPHRYITDPYINRYYIPRTQNVTIIKNTTIINNVNERDNVNYVSGPRREDVERINHTQVRTYTVANAARPGRTVINNNTVNVYRPVINRNNVTINNNNTVVKSNNNKTNVVNNRAVINKNNNTVVNSNNNVKINNAKNQSVLKAQQRSIGNATANQPKNNLPPVTNNASRNNNKVVKDVQTRQAQLNRMQQNNVQRNHVNNPPAQMRVNNNRPQMQRAMPQPHPMQGGAHPKKPGR